MRSGSIPAPKGRSVIGSRASAVPPNSPPRCALAPRPAAGNPTCEPLGAAMCTIPVSSGDLAWRRGLDARVPGWHCGLVPGGAAHLYAPSSQAAPPPPPRSGPGRPGRVGGWALLSRAARSRLAPPQAEPPSPAPSVSLPCSRRGRSDLQRSRGARSDRLGAAPPGPGDGGAPRQAGPLSTDR